MGYTNTGYKIWYPDSNQIRVSRNVIFEYSKNIRDLEGEHNKRFKFDEIWSYSHYVKHVIEDPNTEQTVDVQNDEEQVMLINKTSEQVSVEPIAKSRKCMLK